MLEGIVIAVAVCLVLAMILAFMTIITLALSALYRLAGWNTNDDDLSRSIENNEKLLKEIEATLGEPRALQDDPERHRKLPN